MGVGVARAGDDCAERRWRAVCLIDGGGERPRASRADPVVKNWTRAARHRPFSCSRGAELVVAPPPPAGVFAQRRSRAVTAAMGRTPPVSRRTRGALAAELAALTNPAPAPAPAGAEMLEDDDFDPTGGALARSPADDDSDAGASDSGSPGASEDDGVFRPTREDVAAEREGTERKLRMRASIAQDDAEYVGKSSSRRAMERAWAGDEEEEEEDESDESDDDESDGGGDDESDDDEESDGGDDDDEDDEGGEPSDARLAASARDSEEEGDDVAALAARASESDPESDPAASDSEDASLRAELASFRAEEAEAVRLARAKSKNVAKGVAVRRQNDAWARALRTRIVLQKSVGVVAKFPTPRYHAAMRSEDDDVAPAMEEAARAAKAALAVLGTLQAALLDANPAVDEARAEEEEDPDRDSSDPRTKKRRRESATAAFARRNVRAGSSADDVWAALDATYARFAAFRDRSCDRWHRKANVQTGKASSSGGGGGDARGAFDRALSEQVASAMRPPDRLLARSRPPAHLAPRRLGEPKVGTLPGAHDARDGDEKGRAPDAPARALVFGNDRGRVEELYDDADFYEQSLKEFWIARRRRRRGGSGGARGAAEEAAEGGGPPREQGAEAAVPRAAAARELRRARGDGGPGVGGETLPAPLRGRLNGATFKPKRAFEGVSLLLSHSALSRPARRMFGSVRFGSSLRVGSFRRGSFGSFVGAFTSRRGEALVLEDAPEHLLGRVVLVIEGALERAPAAPGVAAEAAVDRTLHRGAAREVLAAGLELPSTRAEHALGDAEVSTGDPPRAVVFFVVVVGRFLFRPPRLLLGGGDRDGSGFLRVPGPPPRLVPALGAPPRAAVVAVVAVVALHPVAVARHPPVVLRVMVMVRARFGRRPVLRGVALRGGGLRGELPLPPLERLRGLGEGEGEERGEEDAREARGARGGAGAAGRRHPRGGVEGGRRASRGSLVVGRGERRNEVSRRDARRCVRARRAPRRRRAATPLVAEGAAREGGAGAPLESSESTPEASERASLSLSHGDERRSRGFLWDLAFFREKNFRTHESKTRFASPALRPPPSRSSSRPTSARPSARSEARFLGGADSNRRRSARFRRAFRLRRRRPSCRHSDPRPAPDGLSPPTRAPAPPASPMRAAKASLLALLALLALVASARADAHDDPPAKLGEGGLRDHLAESADAVRDAHARKAALAADAVSRVVDHHADAKRRRAEFVSDAHERFSLAMTSALKAMSEAAQAWHDHVRETAERAAERTRDVHEAAAKMASDAVDKHRERTKAATQAASDAVDDHRERKAAVAKAVADHFTGRKHSERRRRLLDAHEEDDGDDEEAKKTSSSSPHQSIHHHQGKAHERWSEWASERQARKRAARDAAWNAAESVVENHRERKQNAWKAAADAVETHRERKRQTRQAVFDHFTKN